MDKKKNKDVFKSVSPVMPEFTVIYDENGAASKYQIIGPDGKFYNTAVILPEPTVPDDVGKVLSVNSEGKKVWAAGGGSVVAGDAIRLDGNEVNVKFDGTSIKLNADGELEASATALEAGSAIDITDDTISVKYDNDSIKVNSAGKLYAVGGKDIVGTNPILVEEDDDEYDISLKVSAVSGNGLEVKTDGLYANALEVEAGTSIVVEDVTATKKKIDVKVSEESGNSVEVKDDGLYVGALEVQAGNAIELTDVTASKKKVDVKVDDDTIKINADNALEATQLEAGDALEIEDYTANVLVDGTTITVDGDNKLHAVPYFGGDAIEVDGLEINALVDDDSVKVVSNKLSATKYTGGDGIDVTDYEVSAKYDDDSIKLNTNGELYADFPVTSVNGKDGDVVLDATDIKLTTTGTTVQANIIRIDGELNRIEGKVDDNTEAIEAEVERATEAEENLQGGIDGLEDRKQDRLTAGDNITIIENIISASGGVPSHTIADKGKVLTVLEDNTIDWYQPTPTTYDWKHVLKLTKDYYQEYTYYDSMNNRQTGRYHYSTRLFITIYNNSAAQISTYAGVVSAIKALGYTSASNPIAAAGTSQSTCKRQERDISGQWYDYLDYGTQYTFVNFYGTSDGKLMAITNTGVEKDIATMVAFPDTVTDTVSHV